MQTIHDLCRLPLTHFSKKEIPAPYNVALCRKSMYQLLQSILLTSMSMRPSPDQVIIRSFSVGLNDHSLEVRNLRFIQAGDITSQLKCIFSAFVRRC